MEYRRLGKSGLKVSEFSFGSWVTFGKQVDIDSAAALIGKAYDKGVNFFDNAEGYESGASEQVMGDAIKKLGLARDTYAISTKVFWGGPGPLNKGLNRKHIFDACHAGLKRMSVDYLDMYFCHRPDIETPIEETVRAMSDLVTQGKVMYWGTSEWSAQQITEAYGVARQYNLMPPTMEQPQYNLFERQKVEGDFRPIYDLMGLGTTIWSPLASGLLTGKYNDGIPDDSRLNLPGYEWLKEMFESPTGQARLEKIKQLAILSKEVGLPLHHLALLWCLENPNVSTVILGASKIEQLEDNLSALDSKDKITSDVLEKIEEIVGTKPAAPQTF